MCGRALQKFCMGMLKVDFRISTISLPRKVILWPITIPTWCKKTPNLENIGCFFGKIFQNAPNFANWAYIGSGTETHPSIYQKWQKSTLKPLSIPVYHPSWYHQPVRAPPGTNQHQWQVLYKMLAPETIIPELWSQVGTDPVTDFTDWWDEIPWSHSNQQVSSDDFILIFGT